MANSISDTILKVIVDAAGVKAGVNAAIQDLSRLESATKSAANRIDNELKKLNRQGRGQTTGTTGFFGDDRSPARAPGSTFGPPGFRRDVFEGREAFVSQGLQAQKALESIAAAGRVYARVVSGAADELNKSTQKERALNIDRQRLSQAIEAEQRSLNSRNASLQRGGASALRAGSVLDPDEAASVLAAIRRPVTDPKPERDAAEAIRLESVRLKNSLKALGVKADLSGKSVEELTAELDQATAAVRYLNQKTYAVAASLGKQKSNEIQEAFDKRLAVEKSLANQKETERVQGIQDYQRSQAVEKSLANQKKAELDQRNRVISGLAAQRAAALADKDNLRALNRFERSRGQSLSVGLPAERRPLFDRAADGVGGFAEGATSKVTSVAIGALRKVGNFIVTEFTNFVSRVAANLTSRFIAAALEGIVAISSKAIEAAARYEDALVSFGVLAGSKDRGAGLVGDLQKLAIDTPFKLQEVLDESKLLLSYGVAVDDITKRLRQLGDVASGTGVDLGRLSLAFGQSLAKGRLQGPEIRQFTEAGVGIRDFVSAFNEIEGKKVSTQGFLALVEAGQVSSRVVEVAFDKMTSAGGRFFNLMEERSKTVRGRFNALTESLELVAQKVGKAVFDKLGVGQGIDVLVKKLQGINFGSIEKSIGEFAQPVQTFTAQVFAGIEGVLKDIGKRLFGSLSPETLGDALRKLAEDIIPAILRAGEGLVQVFFSVAQAASRFAQVVELVATKILPGESNIGSTVTAVGVGAIAAKVAVLAAGTFLTGTGIGTPLGLGLLAAGTGIAGYGLSKGFGANVFGNSRRDGSETGAAERFTVALGEAARQLEAFKPGDTFQAAAKKDAAFRLKELQDADAVRRQRKANEINFATAEAGVLRFRDRDNPFKFIKGQIDPNEEFSRRLEERLRLAGVIDNSGIDSAIRDVNASRKFFGVEHEGGRTFIPIQEGQQRGALNRALNPFRKLVPDFKFDEDANPIKELERLRAAVREARAAQINAEFVPGGGRRAITGEDIKRTEGLIVKFGTAIDNVRVGLEGLSDRTIPDFRRRAENVNKLAQTPVEDAFGELQKDLATVQRLNGPVLRLFGDGLDDKEAGLARGRLGQAFIERFKAPDRQPAPLIRANTQEAEQALTKAIYDSINNDKTAEEKLRAAQEEASRQLKDNTKALAELGKALDPANGRNPFGAVGAVGFGGN